LIFYQFYYIYLFNYLHSFPTRRSSDLVDKCVENFVLVSRDTLSLFLPMLKEEALNLHAHKKISSLLVHHCSRDIPVFQEVAQLRSEEHTSELQSRFDLVCRLLLEP